MDAPKHSSAFRARRVMNWLPLGLSYAFLYMGRYNLTVAKSALGDSIMSKADFGDIFGIGAIVYGIAFVINGPLTDRIGGRKTMLLGVVGSIVANLLMGLTLYANARGLAAVPVVPAFKLLYAANMYFQSFGAVAIVTINAPWFHVRERGTFSTLFGVMIASGTYFAFDWGFAIVGATRGTLGTDLGIVSWLFRAVVGTGGTGTNQDWWLFFTPALLLAVLWVVLLVILRDSPGKAGHADFDTGAGSVSDDGERLPVHRVFLKLITHPVLMFVCGIEFCSGILRNGVMHWYPLHAKEVGIYDDFFITDNWGLMLLTAGILGSALTGWASDRFFGSRRAPMAGVLYGVMLVATLVMALGLGGSAWVVGLSAVTVSMAVIGVHGILSGTSTADFAGRKNTGAAVGAVDGLVYLGTAVQSIVIGRLAPTGEAAKDPNAWLSWPLFLAPFALVGLLLSLRIWNARPQAARRAQVVATSLPPAAPATPVPSPVAAGTAAAASE